MEPRNCEISETVYYKEEPEGTAGGLGHGAGSDFAALSPSDLRPPISDLWPQLFSVLAFPTVSWSVVCSLQWPGFKPGSSMWRRKSEPGKLTMAARLRREMTHWLKAIAADVGLGTSKSANARLHEWMQPNQSA